MSESESQESGSRPLRRVRVKKKRRRQRRPWRERAIFRYGPDLLILLLLLLAIGLLFLPFGTRAGEAGGSWQQILEPLLVNRVNVVLGGLLLLVALIAGAFRLRWRINQTTSLWMRRCPACGNDDLRRARRIRRDRLLGHLGIPVRRYICPECRWVGARIDQHRL
ncbi:MAG: hypothetical protein R3248_09670 [Candidatus Promineifilaceae bacterium]|nr:hypothetical protein [Candidatus Promineifilaceae bacterium]